MGGIRRRGEQGEMDINERIPKIDCPTELYNGRNGVCQVWAIVSLCKKAIHHTHLQEWILVLLCKHAGLLGHLIAYCVCAMSVSNTVKGVARR